MKRPRSRRRLAVPAGFELVEIGAESVAIVRSDHVGSLAGPGRTRSEASGDLPSGRPESTHRCPPPASGRAPGRDTPRRVAPSTGADPSGRAPGLLREWLIDPECVLQATGSAAAAHPGAAEEPPGSAGRDERDDQGRGGRGPMARLSGGEGRSLILKRYRRGGALAGVLPDLFLGTRRMLADLEASEKARAAGIPCAAAVALVLKRRGGWLWAAYLLSEVISEAATLARALSRERTVGKGALALARQAVLTTRRLHDAGIVHRDLNLRNLLAGEGRIFVIDFDGARLLTAVPAAERFENLSRLDRSYVKTFGSEGPLSHAERRGLLADYSAGDPVLLRELESRLPAHKRRLLLHRLTW